METELKKFLSFGYKETHFDSAEQMFDAIKHGIDLYNIETETYVFLYNEEDAICYYYLPLNEAIPLVERSLEIDDYWSASLGLGGYIVESNDAAAQLDWCNDNYRGTWYMVS